MFDRKLRDTLEVQAQQPKALQANPFSARTVRHASGIGRWPLRVIIGRHVQALERNPLSLTRNRRV